MRGNGFVLLVFLGVLLSASPALADNQLASPAVSPASGYARVTDFVFSVMTDAELPEGNEVLLQLFRPTIENEWGWIDIPTQKQSDGSYGISQKLQEHSAEYRFRFALKDTATGTIIQTTDAVAGPQLLIDQADSDAPTVSRTLPKNKSIGVPTAQPITLIFSEVIDPDSVTEDSVKIAYPEGADGSYRAAAFQNRVIITFNEKFMQSTEISMQGSKYTLSVSGVRDLNGNMMEPYSFSFFIAPPLHQTYQIESDKYEGYCLAVRNNRGRFDDPTDWKPVVQLAESNDSPEAVEQRWFLSASPDSAEPLRLFWAENINYCLTKDGDGKPYISKYDRDNNNQLFNLKPGNDHYRISSQTKGRCVAASAIDYKGIGKNSVQSSLCWSVLPRNRWKLIEKGKAELQEPYFIGMFDMNLADIIYSNPEAEVALSREDTVALVKRLYSTNCLNQHEIYEELNLIDKGENKGEGFVTANPYYPRNTNTNIAPPRVRTAVVDGKVVENPEGYEDTHEGYYIDDNGNTQYYQQEVVTQWFSDLTNGGLAQQQVCAVQFVDQEQIDYNMQTFNSKEEAEQAGWTVTHQGKCGTCSTLKDLAVYIGVKDQTTPIRLCSKRGMGKVENLNETLQCITQSVGFTPLCAESWAYNSQHTGESCMIEGLQTFGNGTAIPLVGGVVNMVILENFDACPAELVGDDPELHRINEENGCPLADENTGRLNDTLWCDEKKSGPGFKYSAARTRRASGLKSAIPRPNDKLYYEADHTKYFTEE